MANSGRSSFALCSTFALCSSPLQCSPLWTYQVCSIYYTPLWTYQGILFSLTEGKQWTLYCSAVNIKQTEGSDPPFGC